MILAVDANKSIYPYKIVNVMSYILGEDIQDNTNVQNNCIEDTAFKRGSKLIDSFIAYLLVLDDIK